MIPTILSTDERRTILARAIQTQFSPDMRIESQSDFQAIVVFGRAPNHLLHFLIGVFTLGAWWLVWLLLVLGNRVTRRLIVVDEYGAITSIDSPG